MKSHKIAKTNSGFTLIELLVVIGITAVLFFLLLRPLIDSFNLTKRAQMLTAAQDSARKTLEILTRELGGAVYVFDNDSHPFSQDSPSTSLPNDQFSNFLNLEITDQTGNTILAHAYNAKLDIVQARHQSEGTAGAQIDPTTGLPITLNQGRGSATLNGTAQIFPNAPSSTVIRYFIGLKDPTKPYSNRNEGHFSANSNGTNTYVLYRAQFEPYNTGNIANTSLLATTTKQVKGNPMTVVEFDDPDFFRYVKDTDINWLDPQHRTYANSPGANMDAASHNQRVDNWVKIAKPIINAPDIDLILLPHNRDNTLTYDAAGDPFPGVAHSGAVHDPVAGATPDPITGTNDWPVINTSITFRPATITADASAATTASYTSQGIPANAADNGGLPYVPTAFTATAKSWSYPYTVTLYAANDPSGNNGYYQTTVAPSANTTAGMYMDPGDVIETMYTSPTDTGTPVYNITLGQTLNGSHNCVPMSINPDTGTVNFEQPALPNGPNDKYNRFWTLQPADINTGNAGVGVTSPGSVDLTKLSNSPFYPSDGASPSNYWIANAHVVPASVRVYGPDATPGPNFGNSVMYTQVFGGDTLGYNQYLVNYAGGVITFHAVSGGDQLPTVKDLPAGSPAGTAPPGADPVQISFDYQANLTLADATKPISANNPASPMLVKVDYQTRDLIEISVGVRVFDPANGGLAQIVTVSNKVQVGNTNR